MSTAMLPEQSNRAERASRRLKVCLASRAPFVGGAEVAAERLALGLKEEGHEVFFILGQEGTVRDRYERQGLRCILLPLAFRDGRRPWRHFWGNRAVHKVLRRERPDVLHSNDLPTHQMVAKAARSLRIPRLCHHRFPFDGEAIDWFNTYGGERHLFVSRSLMDEMCAASSALRDSSREVLYDGLPLPSIPSDEDRRQARLRLALPLDRLLVLFAGQIIERKGVADLLRAWVRLESEVVNRAELLIVGDDLQGDGAYRSEMERLAADLMCPARFFGFQKNVADWLIASDIAVVPSHVEPLGNATLEAMALARPVVGCNVGGIPEMIVAGETGLLVPARDPESLAASLRTMLLDSSLRRRMGEAARQRCQSLFSLDTHVRAVLQEYARLLPRR